jgi:helix-turn-helix, Psq domain
MSQQQRAKSIQKTGRIEVAIEAIKLGQFQSQRQAAAVYDVPRETLRDQINGSRPRRDCEVNSKKLSNHEEDIISEHILDRVSRGYPPKLAEVRDMADNILAGRGGKPVGKHWPNNYVNRRPELKTRFNRKYDYQRAKNEDPVVIATWFRLVRATKDKYAV